MDDLAYWIDENGDVRVPSFPPKIPHQDCGCLTCRFWKAEVEVKGIRQEKDGSWSQRL